MDIQHIAIAVADLERTLAFYEDGLGLDYAWDFHTDEGVHNYYVTGDDLETWIQFVHDPSDDSEIDPSGIVHIAISVDDVDGTFERLVSETDCPVAAEPTTQDAAGARAAFVNDPDGYEVELFSKFE